MTSPARIVLVMPVRNEARDIADVLSSLEAQTIDHARLYLYVVDGESDDGTATLLAAWLRTASIAGEVISNLQRTIPVALNLGIARASVDDIIVRLDGHTIYGPDYLQMLVEALEAAPADVACVGGPQRPVADERFAHRVVATLYSNRFGLGGSEHRISTVARFVSQVYLGVWRPGVLQQIGGFDERWRANEDSEICARMLAAGYRILWLPVESRYRINRGMRRTVLQWGGYGYWRAQTLRRHPAIARPRHYLAPAGLMFALLLLFTPLRAIVLLGYLGYVTLVWLNRDRSESFTVTATSLLFLPACQAAWALGVIRGTLMPLSTRIAAALALIATVACSTAAPSPAPPQHLPTLTHLRTLSFIDWTGKPYTFGTHWATLRPYVDEAIISPRAANALAALGIKTGFYVTVHTICIARSYGECQPDARTMPEAAFVHSCAPPYGRVMWNPEKSAANPHPFYQFLGDVHSPVLATRWNDFLDRMRSSPDGAVHYDFAFEDNAAVPGDNLSWQHYYVQGTGAEQSPRPYCNYSDASYMQAELQFENQAHMPLLLNALAVSDNRPRASLAVSYLPHSRNARGGMLEYTYGSTISGPQREKEGDDLWRSEENSELGMVRGRKIFVAYPHNSGGDAHAIDIRGYQYASLLLSFDQRYVMLAQDGPGTASGIGLNPEIGLVAADPLVAEPENIESLRAASGAYAREFARCAIWGKPIGGCAAVVNPSSTETVAVPQLAQSYSHRIVISGTGVIRGIDDGRIVIISGRTLDPIAPKGWSLLAQ